MSRLFNRRISSPSIDQSMFDWRSAFDPLKKSPNHINHEQSTSIIKLDESGKVFCSSCFEDILKHLDESDRKLYGNYIKNRLTVLNQHSEDIKLRRVMFQIYGIMLEKEYIAVKTDNEFHNVIRIVLKVMKSDLFESEEFPPIVKIYSTILTKFDNSNPLPLALIWKITQVMLKFSKSELEHYTLNSATELKQDTCDIIGSIAVIIKSYLRVLKRFGNNRSSDKMFILVENDFTQQPQNKDCYSDSQTESLDFMTSKILPRCWGFLKPVDRILKPVEKNLVVELFNTINECLVIAIDVKYSDLLEFLSKNDSIQNAHMLIYKYNEIDFRKPLRKHLYIIVKHIIVSTFGTDRTFERYIKNEDIVQTNHKNAIANSSNSEKQTQTTFYILVNCVAMLLKSSYFFPRRVTKVIKSVDPENLDLKESTVLVRAYLYTAAHVSNKVSKFDIVEHFVKKIWKKLRPTSTLFDEQFCFHEKVLYWVYDHPDFMKLVTVKSIKYILARAVHESSVECTLKNLFKYDHYKKIITQYLKNEDSAIATIEEIIKHDLKKATTSHDIDKSHKELVSNLSNITMSILHTTIWHSINAEDTTGCKTIYRTIKIIVTLMRNCEHFNFVLDDQYIEDMFKFLESLYQPPVNQGSDEILILMNEFLYLLIINNSPYLMKVLKHMNHTVLGYMYQRVADYTKYDYLAESIAELLVAYDNLDYPLIVNIGESLNAMALSVVNWMLSRNDNLHILSLMIAKNILNDEHQSNTTRACVTTGIIHMLSENCKILENRIYMNYLLSIVDTDAFKFNPLVKYALAALPNKMREEISQKLNENDGRPPTPPVSFSSVSGSSFREEQHLVSQILNNNLNTDGDTDSLRRIPDSLYINGLRNQYVGTDNTDEWERKAYEAHHNSKAF